MDRRRISRQWISSSLGWNLVWALALATLAAPVGARGKAVIDNAGAPIKLITTRDTRIHEAPDKSSPAAPVRIFQYYYVLPPDPNAPSHRLRELETLTRDGFYRVASSDSESDYQGWLAEGDAIRWSHRQALRPTRLEGRERMSFYASREEALTAIRTGNTSTATHREPTKSGSQLLLMPILKTEEFSFDGESNALYKVAFVSGDPTAENPAPAPISDAEANVPPGLTRYEILTQTTMDVVFVVDTTNSMANPIAQVRASIIRVIRDILSHTEFRRRLRLGLVAYRDTLNAKNPYDMEYLARVFCTLEEGAQHQIFLERLDDLEVTTVGSEEYPEDVLAGLSLAMDTDQIGWNPLAWKQIVVVADSSAKVLDHPDPDARYNDGGHTIESIMNLAQASASPTAGSPANDFVVSVVYIKNPAVPYDHIVGARQYNTLIAGRRYNGKMITAIGGARPEDFSQELSESLLGGLKNFAQSVLGLDPSMLSKPKPRTASKPSRMTLDLGDESEDPRVLLTAADYPYPIIDLIRRLPNERPDQRFAIRYCTEFDAEGNRALVPHLFARKGRLMNFVNFLVLLQGLLEDAGDPGSRDLESLLGDIKMMTAVLQIDEPITGDLEVQSVIRGLWEIPIKTDIFRLTIGDLAAMSKDRYQEWVGSMTALNENLRALIENPTIWFGLEVNAPERDGHAFIPLADLP